MLPDFPKEKALLRKRLNASIRANIRERHRITTLVQSRRQHEGGCFTLLRENGTEESTEFVAISSTMTIERGRVADMPQQEVEALFGRLVDDLARQEAGHFYQLLDAVAEQGGPGVQSAAVPLTRELLLQMVANAAISFDAYGEPRMPTVILNPNAAEGLADEMLRWESDPEFKRRWDEMLSRKREEFRVREAGRKLVD